MRKSLEVDLLIVCKPEPIERRKQPSQPLLVLCTDGHVNAGFGTADLVLEVIQPVARLRKASVSTRMVDTEQGAADSTCLRLADLAANTFALALRLSLSGWREGYALITAM